MIQQSHQPEPVFFVQLLNGLAQCGKALLKDLVELARAAEKGDVEAISKLDERKQEQKAIELLADLFGI